MSVHTQSNRMTVSGAQRRSAQLSARALWAIVVVGICFISALVATWPLALQATGTIPLGTEQEATVPLFNLWSLWWTADRTAHGFAGYWNAPLFYPNQGVFTFSEPQPLTGLLTAPLWLVGAPPALTYNLALLALLTCNGIFAYRLMRALTVQRSASILAGILTVTLPFTAKIVGVLPLVALFGMLWTLEGLVRFGQDGTTKSAAWAAVGYTATYLTCQQYALLFAPFALAAGLLALSQQGFHARPIIRLGISGLVAGSIILLLALPALKLHAELGFQRSDAVVQALSARPGDFLSRLDTALVGLPPRDTSDAGGLFPGLLLLLLALIGGIASLRTSAPTQRWTLYFLASALVALLLALGLNLSLAGWQPFATLRSVIPGLGELRSPFRFAAITHLFLPPLAALALANLQQSAKRGALIVATLGLLAAAENLAIPLPLAALPHAPDTAWTSWLRQQPEDSVLTHIPFPDGVHVRDYEIETWRLFAQIHHQKPLVNGYSGFFPQQMAPDGSTVIPTYTYFQLAMAEQFPRYELFCVLNKSLGVDLLVIDRHWLEAHREELEKHAQFLELAYSDAQVQIFSLSVPTNECHPD